MTVQTTLAGYERAEIAPDLREKKLKKNIEVYLQNKELRPDQGREQEVWFEDVRSIAAKIELAKEYELYGVGYWNLMRPFRANWIMLE